MDCDYHRGMSSVAEALARLTTARVDTRHAERRAVVLATLDDLSREVERVEKAASAEGEGLRVTGNWSVGQIMVHIARLIERSMDGFGALPVSEHPIPGGLRAIAAKAQRAGDAAGERIARNRMLTTPMHPCGPCAALVGEIDPPVFVWTPDGAAQLRAAVGRVRDKHPMDKPSPTLGRLSGDEWLAIHLRHAELHLSFITLGERR